eukprot:4767694-Amphidinium_carterae.1
MSCCLFPAFGAMTDFGKRANLPRSHHISESVSRNRSKLTIGSGIVTDREKQCGNYFLQPLQLPLLKNTLN